MTAFQVRMQTKQLNLNDTHTLHANFNHVNKTKEIVWNKAEKKTYYTHFR